MLHVLLYIYCYLNPKKGIFIVAEVIFLAASLTAIGLAPSPPIQQAGVILFWISIFSLIYSSFKLFHETLGSPHEIGMTKQDNIIICPPNKDIGFSIIKQNGKPEHQILFSSKFNIALRNNKVLEAEHDQKCLKKVKEHLSLYDDKLSVVLRYLQRQTIPNRQIFRNEDKVGIGSTISENSKTIKFYKTNYFNSMLTNDIWNSVFTETTKGTCVDFYIPDIKSFLDENNCILPINESSFSNHLGANTIAITSNFYLQLWRQSDKSLQSGKLIAPTGSGSCDWQDTVGAKSLNEIALNAMNREIWEESLRCRSLNETIENSMIIGYFRDIRRGGLPGFLGLTKLKVEQAELSPDGKEVTDSKSNVNKTPLLYEVSTFDNLSNTVKKLLEGNISHLSLPLWANLLALQSMINDDSDRLKEFLGYGSAEAQTET